MSAMARDRAESLVPLYSGKMLAAFFFPSPPMSLRCSSFAKIGEPVGEPRIGENHKRESQRV
jgi:hypothetical protein